MRNTVANAGDSAYLKAGSGKCVTVQVEFAYGKKEPLINRFFAAAFWRNTHQWICRKARENFQTISSFCFIELHMRRRTFRQIRAASSAAHHHHVYVVLLAADAAKLKEVRAVNPRRDPAKPCLYVGMTGLTPEERFANHKKGLKASRVVELYGLRLLPEFYEPYNPMPFEAAVEMERELAEDLRAQGYTVTGGH
jgi:hypothetical protein